MSTITVLSQYGQTVTLDHISSDSGRPIGIDRIPEDAVLGSVWHLKDGGLHVITELGPEPVPDDVLSIQTSPRLDTVLNWTDRQSPRIDAVLEWAEEKMAEEIEYSRMLETNPMLKKMHDELQFAIKLHKGIEE
jgi:hypothetical protein